MIKVDTSSAFCDRATLFEHLRSSNIGVNVHYMPVHLQPYYQKLGFSKGDFPVAELYYNNAISLPIYPLLSFDEQMEVINALRSFFI